MNVGNESRTPAWIADAPRRSDRRVGTGFIENTDDLRVELAGACIPCSSGRQLALSMRGTMTDKRHCDLSSDDELKEVVKHPGFRGAFLVL